MTTPTTPEMGAHGWAVVNDGIEVRTVSPSRRAAIVNWLVVMQGSLITQYTSDEEIEEMWKRRHNQVASVRRVVINLAEQ